MSVLRGSGVPDDGNSALVFSRHAVQFDGFLFSKRVSCHAMPSPPGKLESCGSWMENYPLDAPVELSTHGGFRTAVSLD
ncbi:hypothetical protein Plim_0398 [Planctopirus limnophila DSM 3776]|uniref:Uncharacterized protein n=1 Tax=Planctopirus limnophila (strain ATCC 43296 / DSM 3776 / IFAM 1008 / Mu 290) TaxID=521674 RepID=D5SPL8_PLAL2|nr:hypothetical protein Plim_0398 [Planctopirus limnophila DSM 3776]